MAASARRSIELRNLEVAQKLMVLTILLTVGGGYLAAMANLFAQDSGADGVATIKLDEIPSLLRDKGVSAVMSEMEKSLGMEDVIKKYHGSGAGVTRLEASLNGSMREKIKENLTADKPGDQELEKLAESLRQMLIEWSKLPPAAREIAYSKGLPTNDEGDADFVAFKQLLESGKELDESTLTTVVSDTLNENCVSCHAPGADPQAEKMLLTDYDEVNKYCKEDNGISADRLALTTHVHLLGFSVLFALSGFIFSLTSYPAFLRCVLTPWPLFFQVAEIACWWLAKWDVLFAKAIFYLGPAVGMGLVLQLALIFLDLLFRRPRVS